MGRAAGLYVRISQDRDGRALGVARQRQDCERLAEQRGWDVARVYCDNDVSASTGKVRPAYRELLADIETGAVDAVVVWAADRLHRRPAELEGFIDLADRKGTALATVSGDVDLSTPAGRLVARLLGAVARGETETKGQRTRRAQLQAAQSGRWLGGTRPFGWNVNGTVETNRAEAREVRRLCEAVLAGDSLGSLVRDLNARGVHTTRGGAWSYATLRQALLRPRNAGLSSYGGEIVDRDGWPPLVAEETWRAVAAILSDVDRRTSTSNRGRWLLSGLARCGAEGCEQTVKSSTATSTARTRTTRTVYRCASGGHLARSAEPVDDLVTRTVLARLSRPDAADLLVETENRPDSEALRDEAMALRAQLDEAAGMYAEQAITAAQLRTITERLRARLADVERQQASTSRGLVLADLVQARDAERVWRSLPLARRRAVVDTLMVVTILPSGRRGNAFDPALVHLDWRTS